MIWKLRIISRSFRRIAALITIMCDLEVKVASYKFWSKAESAWKSTVSSDTDVFFSLVTSNVEEDDDSTKVRASACTNTDEFSEKFQTALNLFRKCR